MKTLFVLALASFCGIAADGPVREVNSLATRDGNVPVAAFQNGYLYFLNHAVVRLYAPDGYPAFVAVLRIPNGSDSWAKGLAVDSDGSVAVSVSYQTAGGLGGGVFFFSTKVGFRPASWIRPAICLATCRTVRTIPSGPSDGSLKPGREVERITGTT